MQDVPAVQERQSAHHFFEERQDVIQPEEVDRLLSCLPALPPCGPGCVVPAVVRVELDLGRGGGSLSGVNEPLQAAPVRKLHQDVQGRDSGHEAGPGRSRRFEPGVVIRDDVRMRSRFEHVHFTQN